MPAKSEDAVITVGEARKLFKDPSSMKCALHFLQFAAGDRKEDPRMREPNQTDADKGYRRIEDPEREEIRRIVGTLIDAACTTE